ncbi:hypothetical protein Hanom_Chr17g01548321 [Helianthus anomalus]
MCNHSGGSTGLALFSAFLPELLSASGFDSFSFSIANDFNRLPPSPSI